MYSYFFIKSRCPTMKVSSNQLKCYTRVFCVIFPICNFFLRKNLKVILFISILEYCNVRTMLTSVNISLKNNNAVRTIAMFNKALLKLDFDIITIQEL